MKMYALIAAALVAGAAMPAVADASGQKIVTRTTVTRSTDGRSDRGWRGQRTHWKTVCSTTWRNHRHIRTCRKVRVRY
ncbi:hypothetical protein [Sphingomonas sp.]|jgi:hypothetical protein|uniref:hypothetical protein n=1 Tax=Sphingomonas sp. TaxID=28214 RepID=UPI002E327ED6|nr:hypothetical protein [Sphingomonas sp.]HEX4693919.1 hypothetical protein [Sphingomonas sp.]